MTGVARTRRTSNSPTKDEQASSRLTNLPEDAAKRWMSTAAYQASQTMLRKHGGDYIDTKSGEIPQTMTYNRMSSCKKKSTSGVQASDGVLCGVSEIGDESERRNKDDKTLKLQQKELKRIM